jgi:hypothetical protein
MQPGSSCPEVPLERALSRDENRLADSAAFPPYRGWRTRASLPKM